MITKKLKNKNFVNYVDNEYFDKLSVGQNP